MPMTDSAGYTESTRYWIVSGVDDLNLHVNEGWKFVCHLVDVGPKLADRFLISITFSTQQ